MAVVEYARKRSLLDNPYWRTVRDLALDPAYQEMQDSLFKDDDGEAELPDDEPHTVEFVPLSEAENFTKTGAAADRVHAVGAVQCVAAVHGRSMTGAALDECASMSL